MLQRVDILVDIGYTVHVASLKQPMIDSGDLFLFEKLSGRQGAAVWR